jgi:hypothetical protein
MPECRTVRLPVSPVPDELKCRYREQSRTGIRRSSPVPECSVTRLRCWMPECRCRRHWTQCGCPAMSTAEVWFSHVKIFKRDHKSKLKEDMISSSYPTQLPPPPLQLPSAETHTDRDFENLAFFKMAGLWFSVCS